MQGAFSSNLGQLFFTYLECPSIPQTWAARTYSHTSRLSPKQQAWTLLLLAVSGYHTIARFHHVCLLPKEMAQIYTNLFQKEIALPNSAECIQLRKRCKRLAKKLRIVKYGWYDLPSSLAGGNVQEHQFKLKTFQSTIPWISPSGRTSF